MTFKPKSATHNTSHCYELLLFVSPLDPDSFRLEKEVFSALNKSTQQTSLRIFCYHDDALRDQDGNPQLKCVDFNFIASYRVALAFKTASLQGKQAANGLLLSMQKAFIEDGERCYDESVKNIIQKNDVDYQTWLKDFTSRYIHSDYQKDIQLMKEMSVKTLPTLFISDSLNADVTLKVENYITAKTLEELFTYLSKNSKASASDNPSQPSLKLKKKHSS